MNIRRIVLSIAAAVLFTNVTTQAAHNGLTVSKIRPSFNFELTTEAGNCFDVSVNLAPNIAFDLEHYKNCPTDIASMKFRLQEQMKTMKPYFIYAFELLNFVTQNFTSESMLQKYEDLANDDSRLEQYLTLYVPLQKMLDAIANDDESDDTCCEVEFNGLILTLFTDGFIILSDAIFHEKLAVISIKKVEDFELEDEGYQA